MYLHTETRTYMLVHVLFCFVFFGSPPHLLSPLAVVVVVIQIRIHIAGAPPSFPTHLVFIAGRIQHFLASSTSIDFFRILTLSLSAKKKHYCYCRSLGWTQKRDLSVINSSHYCCCRSTHYTAGPSRAPVLGIRKDEEQNTARTRPPPQQQLYHINIHSIICITQREYY